MRVRKLDQNGDMSFGHGLRDFWIDVPDGPAQAALTRLMLWLGEWFLDLEDGMPWNTQVLGKYTGDLRDVAIQTRVLGTPGVTEIVNYYSQFTTSARKFSAQVTLNTPYGLINTRLEPK